MKRYALAGLIALGVTIAMLVPHAPVTAAPASYDVAVVDQDAKPVVGALVIRLDGPVAGGGTGYAVTDARGHFSVPQSDWCCAFDIWPPEARGGLCAGKAHIDYTDHSGRVTMQLAKIDPATVRGRVVDSRGKPVCGARVEVLAEVLPSCNGDILHLDPVTTAADGGFSFSVFDGQAEVYVTAQGFAPHDALLRTGEPSTVALDEGASWRGRVLGASGKPLTHAKISATWGDRPALDLPLVAGGFDMSGLIPGPYTVRIEVTDDSVLATRWEVRTVTLTDHEHHVEDMRFASGLDISGVISDAHGCVIAAPAEYNRNGVSDARVHTTPDAAGRFVFHQLSRGKWVISNCIQFPTVVVVAGTSGVVVPAP